MPLLYEACLRHASHYAKVATTADQDFRHGKQYEAMKLFDQERPQIDSGWQWVREKPYILDCATLILDYATATAEIGGLRYHPQNERIPQFEDTLHMIMEQNDRRHVGFILATLGDSYAALGETKRAISLYTQAFETINDIDKTYDKSKLLNNLGRSYYDMGDTQKAIELYEQALIIAHIADNKHAEINILNNLGFSYYRLRDFRNFSVGDYNRAIYYHDQALSIARDTKDQISEGRTLGYLGAIYAKIGNYPQAIAYLQKGLKMANSIGDKLNEGKLLNYLGDVYHCTGDTLCAIDFYKRAIQVAYSIGNRIDEAYFSGNLGWSYIQVGERKMALHHLSYAQDMFDELQIEMHPWFRVGLLLLKMPGFILHIFVF